MADPTEDNCLIENNKNEQVCSSIWKPLKKNKFRKRTVVDNEEDDEDNSYAKRLSKAVTDYSRDARALKQAKEALKGKNKPSGDEMLFKGMNRYTYSRAFFRHEQIVAAMKAALLHEQKSALCETSLSAESSTLP